MKDNVSLGVQFGTGCLQRPEIRPSVGEKKG